MRIIHQNGTDQPHWLMGLIPQSMLKTESMLIKVSARLSIVKHTLYSIYLDSSFDMYHV